MARGEDRRDISCEYVAPLPYIRLRQVAVLHLRARSHGQGCGESLIDPDNGNDWHCNDIRS